MKFCFCCGKKPLKNGHLFFHEKIMFLRDFNKNKIVF